MRPVAPEVGLVQRLGVRNCRWVWAVALVSACLQPVSYQFPEDATRDAKAVVWLVPDEAPVVQEVNAELRVPLQIQGDAHPRALLYGCSPEELRLEALIAEHACLPPTQRQLVSVPGEVFLKPAPDGAPFSACGPCGLWPAILRLELQLPESQRSFEVGVVLADGRVLMTVGSSTSTALLRVDLKAGTVEALQPSEGTEARAFGPYWRDETGLYGLRDGAVWSLEIEGGRYRAQQLTPAQPLAFTGGPGALRRSHGKYDLATAYGGLVRTSSTSSTGWAVVRPNRPDLEEADAPIRASFSALGDRGLVAVGIVWEDEHYQLDRDNSARLFGYLRELDGRVLWSSLPSKQVVVSAVQDRDRAYVVSALGEVYRFLPDGGVELSWSAEQRQDLRLAVAGPGRIWAAPFGGSFFPIYPDQGPPANLSR